MGTKRVVEVAQGATKTKPPAKKKPPAKPPAKSAAQFITDADQRVLDTLRTHLRTAFRLGGTRMKEEGVERVFDAIIGDLFSKSLGSSTKAKAKATTPKRASAKTKR